MDFFSNQRKARKNTAVLVLLFVLAVIILILAIYLAVAFFGQKMWSPSHYRMDEVIPPWWYAPKIFGFVVLGTLTVVGIGMITKISQLSQGGPAVAELLGGRLVLPESRDTHERRLRNVVEEMAIASGIAVPQVYVMDNEPGINAFAAGYSPSDSAVAVTRGCLEQLNRQELEGVIAHEFSHVLNGDMRLNIRLMGVLHGILCLSIAGWTLLRTGFHTSGVRDRDGGGAPLAMLGGILYVLGYIGVFFGKLIKAGASRQREYLADASGVQFTRNPSGLGDALKKIAGFEPGTKLRNSHAEEASHMMFANGVGGWLSGLLATHPPIGKRISALDPWFKHFAKDAAAQSGSSTAAFGEQTSGFASGSTGRETTVEHVMASTGQLSPELIAHGKHLVAQLPLDLGFAVREPFSARAVVYCLVLSRDTNAEQRQLQLLKEICDAPTLAETFNVRDSVRALQARLRLPVLDLTLPALRNMSPDQYREFRENLHALAQQDSVVSLFGFVLEKVMLRHLDSAYVRVKVPPVRYRSPRKVMAECGVVLSILAHGGHTSDALAVEAYNRAFDRLLHGTTVGSVERPTMLQRDACRLGTLDQALTRLARSSFDLKRAILAAMAESIATDGRLDVFEHELLRAAADTLDCPLPPLPLSD